MKQPNYSIIPLAECSNEEIAFLNAISDRINLVLGVQGINLELIMGCANDYLGEHNISKKTIGINQKLYDDVLSLRNYNKSDSKQVGLYFASYAKLVGTIAHETMHYFQSINSNEKIEEDFEREMDFANDLITYEEYVNLDIELEARAFEAIVQEFLINRSFPLPESIDKEEYNKKYEELKDKYLPLLTLHMSELKMIKE